jgi:hypothetical protein
MKLLTFLTAVLGEDKWSVSHLNHFYVWKSICAEWIQECFWTLLLFRNNTITVAGTQTNETPAMLLY